MCNNVKIMCLKNDLKSDYGELFCQPPIYVNYVSGNLTSTKVLLITCNS